MTTFFVTVEYRTKTTCSSWSGEVEGQDHSDALAKGRAAFMKARPRAMRIDRVTAY
jgi:hypothetical protein